MKALISKLQTARGLKTLQCILAPIGRLRLHPSGLMVEVQKSEGFRAQTVRRPCLMVA
jgi:hypothetical protein